MNAAIAKLLIQIAAALCLVLLVGCTTQTGPGQVARDWSCKIREMQIRPLFPPREDFHVGDLYWLDKVAESDASGYCMPSKEYFPFSSHIAYFPEVMNQADEYYKSRPDFPRTTTSAGTVTIGTTGIVITPGYQSTDVLTSTKLFTVGAANRTRLVGFPDFLSVKVDNFSLGAIIPIQGAFTPFGLSAADIGEASISIPVAESYEVPIDMAIRAIQPSKSICSFQNYVGTSKEEKESGQFHLVTAVYYTRVIDVNIQSKSGVALGSARDRDNPTTTTLPAITGTGVVSPGAIGTNPQASVTFAQIDSAVSGMLQSLAARNSVPGVSLAYERGHASTISMRRVFDRPVAIGFRSVVVKPDKSKDDQCVLNVSDQPSSTATDAYTPAGAKNGNLE